MIAWMSVYGKNEIGLIIRAFTQRGKSIKMANWYICRDDLRERPTHKKYAKLSAFTMLISKLGANAAHHMTHLREIIMSAVNSVRPEVLLSNKKLYDFVPKVKDDHLSIKIQTEHLTISKKEIHIIGFGKAVLGMAGKLYKDLGPYLHGGVLSTPVASIEQFKAVSRTMDVGPHLSIHEGALHNLPDEAAHRAAKRIFQLAQSMTKNDILIVLVSGGGSALLPMPRPPLTVAAKCQLIRKLSNKGASITEMNTVRIALSECKGGRLAYEARNAHAIVTLAISDIVGDSVDVLASGPTHIIVDREMSPREVLKKYNMYHELPKSIKKLVDEPIPQELRNPLPNSLFYLIGNLKVATQAAETEARLRKYEAHVVSNRIQGTVEDVVDNYIAFMKILVKYKSHKIKDDELRQNLPQTDQNPNDLYNFVKRCLSSRKPVLFIFGGEPTVVVKGNGEGGRCQELALRMSLQMYENPELTDFIFVSASTDGQDGPTMAAGAFGGSFVINDFLSHAGQTIQNVKEFLNNSDSYRFYQHLNDGAHHIITGYTGTNVMDLHLILLTVDRSLPAASIRSSQSESVASDEP